LVVPTAGSGRDSAWPPAQNDMATLSTNSVRRVIDGATHMSLIVDEDATGTTRRSWLQGVSGPMSLVVRACVETQ
jgi:hypothetical protein